MIRVLVVDDDRLMRAGLIELLGVDPEISIVGEAATGHIAVELTGHLDPDVVLMDVRMPDGDGISATQQISARFPSVRVLILTTFDQDDYVFGALDAGASGFMLKRAKPEDLIAAVHTIADGDSLLAPEVTRRVIDRTTATKRVSTGSAELTSLTSRERDVFDLLAKGLSNRAIAETLYVEESTVRTHVKRVLQKLNLRDRVHVVIYAYENRTTI
jgi:DNA-binding NarL/FixJ family response regulator